MPSLVVTEGGRAEHRTFQVVCGHIEIRCNAFARVYARRELLLERPAQRVATTDPRRASCTSRSSPIVHLLFVLSPFGEVGTTTLGGHPEVASAKDVPHENEGFSVNRGWPGQ